MRIASKVALNPIYQRGKPVRDRAYLQFVKRFACVACCSTRCVDPAHTGPHAMGQKASDLDVIPLCRKCHDLFDADPKGFASKNGLDIPALIRGFIALWKARQQKTAYQPESPRKTA